MLLLLLFGVTMCVATSDGQQARWAPPFVPEPVRKGGRLKERCLCEIIGDDWVESEEQGVHDDQFDDGWTPTRNSQPRWGRVRQAMKKGRLGNAQPHTTPPVSNPSIVKASKPPRGGRARYSKRSLLAKTGRATAGAATSIPTARKTEDNVSIKLMLSESVSVKRDGIVGETASSSSDSRPTASDFGLDRVCAAALGLRLPSSSVSDDNDDLIGADLGQYWPMAKADLGIGEVCARALFPAMTRAAAVRNSEPAPLKHYKRRRLVNACQ
jgi:hypothetical protein